MTVSNDRDPDFWDTHDFWNVHSPISTHELEALTPEQRARRSADHEAWRARRARAAAAAKAEPADPSDPYGWKEVIRRQFAAERRFAAERAEERSRPTLGELDLRT
jgi:hypothetical protein